MSAPQQIQLTDEYWDCECPSGYIHHQSVAICDKCGALREDCSNSRVNEVLAAGYTIPPIVELLIIIDIEEGFDNRIAAIPLGIFGDREACANNAVKLWADMMNRDPYYLVWEWGEEETEWWEVTPEEFDE